jgi:bisphosphoglycerate-dependent phosphoglycerate mutase
MFRSVILVRRQRQGKSYTSIVLHKGCIDTDLFTKQATFLETAKEIAQKDAENYSNLLTLNITYIIHDLPLGETLESNGGRVTIYWKKDIRELLPDKWKKIVVNGRGKWIRINSKQIGLGL